MSTRRAITRQKLLDAAALEFAEKGYGNASVNVIAGLAGLTTGALYANFSSKTELFLAVAGAQYRAAMGVQPQPATRPASLHDALAEFTRRYANRGAPGNADALARSMEWQALALRDVDGLAVMTNATRAAAFVTTRYFELLAAGDGVQVAADQLAMIVIGLISGAMHLRAIDPEMVDIDAFATAAAHLASAPLPARANAPDVVDVEPRRLISGHQAQPPPDIVVEDLLAQQPLPLRAATPTVLVVLPLSRVGALPSTHAAIRTVAPEPDDARVIFLLIEEPEGPGFIAITGQVLLDVALTLPAAADVLDFHLALDHDGRVPAALDLVRDEPSVVLLDSSGLVRATATGEDPARAAAGMLTGLLAHR